MKTESFNPETIERQWHLVDLDGQTLGRAAARIAQVLRGKHKPTYTPHADCGDFVVVVNADRVVLTGNKLDKKVYYRHSGYMGGLRETTAAELLAKDSRLVIEKAVKGMLPRGPLGRHMFKKMKVYAGADHPHAAQKPAPIDLTRV
ncbi:MAG: 50S ribosomal protein L13 [Deltaproteobacteria bacterium]|nr:MAG: 50S ribosomal protein L13 [Deltaproteobacteria bacterium]